MRQFFSYTDLEKQVRADHPLRVIRQIANAAFKSLSADFGKLYSPIGRGSILPERALRCVAIGRKNYLFAGSDAGGRRAAALIKARKTMVGMVN